MDKERMARALATTAQGFNELKEKLETSNSLLKALALSLVTEKKKYEQRQQELETKIA